MRVPKFHPLSNTMSDSYEMFYLAFPKAFVANKDGTFVINPNLWQFMQDFEHVTWSMGGMPKFTTLARDEQVTQYHMLRAFSCAYPAYNTLTRNMGWSYTFAWPA